MKAKGAHWTTQGMSAEGRDPFPFKDRDLRGWRRVPDTFCRAWHHGG